MKINIYGGMTRDKLIITFVQHHGVDETGKLLPPDPDRYAIHGRKVASLKQISQWAKDMGYTYRVMEG